jgi:ppGpp synthetase/RelA/SpoT-type nucleotidyltranferase
MEPQPSRVSLYDPIELPTKKLQRLGGKIGSRVELDADERDLYEAFIADARSRMAGALNLFELSLPIAQARMKRLDSAEVVGRVKTLSTLADKLERTPEEKLPSVHDVAGIRVVADMSTMEQTILAATLQKTFDSHIAVSRPSRLVDRREHPSHGYRAVHIIIWPAGRPVEIQIRTRLQHAWAELMEVLGDRWGREIRYGQPVKGESETMRSHRAGVVEIVKNASVAIARHEGVAESTAVLHLHLEEVDAEDGSPAFSAERIAELRATAEARAPEIEANYEALESALSSLAEYLHKFELSDDA